MVSPFVVQIISAQVDWKSRRLCGKKIYISDSPFGNTKLQQKQK